MSEYDGLVERLRGKASIGVPDFSHSAIMDEAAAAIVALRAKIARIEVLLEAETEAKYRAAANGIDESACLLRESLAEVARLKALLAGKNEA